MIDPNTETVRRIYAAFGVGDVAAILYELTEDVYWASGSSLKIAPWHGPHQGKAAVSKFFLAVATSVHVTEFTPLCFASNGTDVLVVLRVSFDVLATGKSGTMEIHHWWEFRDGRVCRYRGSEDTALVAELFTT